jgi:UDP-N-acetylglucosamine 2-epimerase (non-hydrolysing)
MSANKKLLQITSTMKRITLIVGARPNWMKAVPVWRELQKQQGDVTIVYTGQHYSKELFDVFLEELFVKKEEIDELQNYPRDASAHQSLAWMIEQLGNYFVEKKTEVVVVFGDVNSTLAGALAATQLKLPIVHVEAGLRCYDMGMPEEINRVLVDKLSTLMTVSEPSGIMNLAREGMAGRGQQLGNSMMDTLVKFLPVIRSHRSYTKYMVIPRKYVVVTIHRQNNVNSKRCLLRIIGMLKAVQSMREVPILFPIHPRTRKALTTWGIKTGKLTLLPPLRYTEMMHLVYYSGCVLTDSGGLQEETTYLGVPCITLRSNTERPITLTHGSNKIISPIHRDLTSRVLSYFDKIFGTRKKNLSVVRKLMGNGNAGKGIASAILAI